MILLCSICNSHCDSTTILYFIRAHSEKYPRRGAVLSAYLPSMGDTAVREENLCFGILASIFILLVICDDMTMMIL